jgi:peptidoglycan/LPS O-acetylase OafA/YrhL
MANNLEKNKTLENIQVLRAIAAFMILVYHFTWHLDNYFSTKFIVNLGSGIILFFVISGFVLWNNLNYEGIFKFYKNRINRIFPSLYLAFFIAFIIKFILFNDVYTALVFLDPRTLLLLPIGEAYSPLGVEWTLRYEVYFYAVLGLFCLFSAKNRAILPSLWLLFLVVITLFFIDEIFIDFNEMSFDPKLKIIFSACGIPFVAGIICRQILNKYKISNPIKFYLFLFSAFFSFLFNIYADSLFKEFSYANIQIIFSIPYCLLIISVAEVKIKNRVLYLFKKAGDYSYGVYLMHVIIITSFLELYKTYLGNYLDYTLVFFMFIFTIILSLMFGWLEHYLYILRKKYSKK